jgi:hypothetical protein
VKGRAGGHSQQESAEADRKGLHGHAIGL